MCPGRPGVDRLLASCTLRAPKAAACTCRYPAASDALTPTSRDGDLEVEDTPRRDRDLLHDGVGDTLVSDGDWNAEGRRHSYQLGERIDLHLPHDPAPVRLDRDLADTELRCDLLVQEAGDDQRHGLPLARRE